MESLRRRAAKMARDYRVRVGQITWADFIMEFSASEDDLITELVDLIEHEPMRGGFVLYGSRAKFHGTR
jgi:hypothetical protein